MKRTATSSRILGASGAGVKGVVSGFPKKNSFKNTGAGETDAMKFTGFAADDGGSGGSGGGGGGGGAGTNSETLWLVNHIIAPGIEVYLTPYHLNRMRTGCSSVPQNPDLVQIAMAHSVTKSLKMAPPDMFTRETYKTSPIHKTDPGPFGRMDFEEAKGLVGPTTKLNPYYTRVMIIKQTRILPPSLENQNFDPNTQQFSPTQEDVYMHVCYDLFNAVFCAPDGSCVFVGRDQFKA